jgi:hypothetical protein
MKSYPSIVGRPPSGTPFYIFDKLDGSNVRAEYSRKRGFHKFGKRNGLLDPAYDVTPFLSQAPGLIMETHSEELARICKKQRWERATFYFEFHGPSSFAGFHQDEPHRVDLLDVSVYRKGFMEPKAFLKLFEDRVPHARLLHHGNFTLDIQEAVAAGEFPGMTFEGIVAKGAWDKKKGRPAMWKYKNLEWFKRLRELCREDYAMYERLA